jgi:hypothetical protein
MPVVTKQVVRAAPTPKRATGSVLSTSIPVAELADDFIKLCVYGRNRVGKTTLACQFPKPLLLVSFEPAKTGGAKSVKKIPGVTIVQIKSSRDAFRLAEELKSDTTFATHVLDTTTSYQDLILQEIIGKPVPEQLDWGSISRDQYRDRSSKLKEALRPFLNLNVHTIMLAQEKDHNSQEKEKPKIIRTLADESFFGPDAGGAAVGWIIDACDYVGQLYMDREVIRHKEEVPIPNSGGKKKTVVHEEETGRFVRRLRTMYHPNFAAGFRSEDPETVPEYIEAPTPKGMYDEIMRVIRGIHKTGGK